MQIHCSNCGKAVSNIDVPDVIIIRARIECPECTEYLSREFKLCPECNKQVSRCSKCESQANENDSV